MSVVCEIAIALGADEVDCVSVGVEEFVELLSIAVEWCSG